jgi:streptogramin lyase
MMKRGLAAHSLAVVLVSFGCGSATLHNDGGSGGTSQTGVDGGAGTKGAAGQGATGVGGGSAGTTGLTGIAGAAGGHAGGGAAGAAACSTPCAATAYCANGTCKSRFTEYSIGTGSDPGYITSGQDGNLWFTTGGDTGSLVGGKIGRLTVSGTPTLFPILAAVNNPYNFTVLSVGIVWGPDGNVWFDDVGSDGKAYISMATPSGVITNYLFSMNDPQVGRVAVGPDGNIWAALTDSSPSSGSNKIEVCTTSGSISEKTLPGYSGPYGITTGPDGNVWFTETSTPYDIARLTLTGALMEFPASPSGRNIVVGADNNLWFTAPPSNIGRSTPNGTVVDFPLPTASSGPGDLTKGPDGNVWFTESAGNNIGSITPGGKIIEYATPASPYGITTGPDGNIWFTEPSIGKVVSFIVP